MADKCVLCVINISEKNIIKNVFGHDDIGIGECHNLMYTMVMVFQ